MSPDNRVVVFPYLKRMCANIDVDQAAAFLLCSYGAARDAGVPDDRIVFLHACAEAHDHWFVTERESLTRSPAIAATVAVSFLGSVTVARCGHLINIASDVSGRWTSSTASRSDGVTSPTARNSLDSELSARLRFSTNHTLPHVPIICPGLTRKGIKFCFQRRLETISWSRSHLPSP